MALFNICLEGYKPTFIDWQSIIEAIEYHQHVPELNGGERILHGFSEIPYSRIGDQEDKGTSQLSTDNHHARKHALQDVTAGGEMEDMFDVYQHFGQIITADITNRAITPNKTELISIVNKYNEPGLSTLEHGKIRGDIGHEDYFNKTYSHWLIVSMHGVKLEFSTERATDVYDTLYEHINSFSTYEAISRDNPHGLTSESLSSYSLIQNLPLHAWQILMYASPSADDYRRAMTTSFHPPDSIAHEEYEHLRPGYTKTDKNSPHRSLTYCLYKIGQKLYTEHSNTEQWRNIGRSLPKIISPATSLLPFLVMGPGFSPVNEVEEETMESYFMNGSIECPTFVPGSDRSEEGYYGFYDNTVINIQYLFAEVYIPTLLSTSQVYLMLYGQALKTVGTGNTSQPLDNFRLYIDIFSKYDLSQIYHSREAKYKYKGSWEKTSEYVYESYEKTPPNNISGEGTTSYCPEEFEILLGTGNSLEPGHYLIRIYPHVPSDDTESYAYFALTHAYLYSKASYDYTDPEIVTYESTPFPYGTMLTWTVRDPNTFDDNNIGCYLDEYSENVGEYGSFFTGDVPGGGALIIPEIPGLLSGGRTRAQLLTGGGTMRSPTGGGGIFGGGLDSGDTNPITIIEESLGENFRQYEMGNSKVLYFEDAKSYELTAQLKYSSSHQTSRIKDVETVNSAIMSIESSNYAKYNDEYFYTRTGVKVDSANVGLYVKDSDIYFSIDFIAFVKYIDYRDLYLFYKQSEHGNIINTTIYCKLTVIDQDGTENELNDGIYFNLMSYTSEYNTRAFNYIPPKYTEALFGAYNQNNVLGYGMTRFINSNLNITREFHYQPPDPYTKTWRANILMEHSKTTDGIVTKTTFEKTYTGYFNDIYPPEESEVT